ncbi:hypothetical protein QUF70_10415 [Desulfobacterales bacterium HSG17]|nr:hypothetical protein [Desulfobacterales bacterium HSG17]
MASNFKIGLQSNQKTIHMNLLGDFDGSSACELINTLKDYCGKFEKIFIHTRGISSIHPFGLKVFKTDLNTIKTQLQNIIFTGEYGGKIAPAQCCIN